MAQRLLLERLTAMAASVLGDQVPVAVVTLETIGLLLEVLGEVAPETTTLLQDPLTWKLTSSHSLLRVQVLRKLYPQSAGSGNIRKYRQHTHTLGQHHACAA